MIELNKIIEEDCLTGLKKLPDNRIDCCVTSPPYFGLRDYGHTEQIGLEQTPELYVAKMVEVFTEVKRVLKKEGTLWLNLGDSYNGSGAGGGVGEKSPIMKGADTQGKHTRATNISGFKPKDLIGIPWMVAFALRSSGWWLRQDIIWAKDNPMPESVTDRCTKSHEYIFLMSKSSRYYFDADSIRTKSKTPLDDIRINAQTWDNKNTPDELRNGIRPKVKIPSGWDIKDGSHGTIHREGRTKAEYQKVEMKEGANKRSVWNVPTQPYSEAHFATFPEDLIVDCIKAGCPEGGIVLDPFGGAGTTALVSAKLNRNYILFEIKKGYINISNKRLHQHLGFFNPAQ